MTQQGDEKCVEGKKYALAKRNFNSQIIAI